MFGGIAIGGNLLCIAYTAAQGHVFLVDLEDGRMASHWTWHGADGTQADAGGVAFDAAFHIYVADTRSDVVRSFTAFGRPVRTYGAEHQRGPGAARRDAHGWLDRPHAVAVFGDSLWVAGGERWLLRGVQRFALDGRPLGALRSFGESDSRFGAPRGLAVGADGVFVADTLHGVVQRFRLDGAHIGRIATAIDPQEASRPIAVLPRAGGELLVIDEGDQPGLRRIRLDQRPELLPVNVSFEAALGLAADERGRIYVLDRHGQRVHRLTADLDHDGVIVDLTELSIPVD